MSCATTGGRSRALQALDPNRVMYAGHGQQVTRPGAALGVVRATAGTGRPDHRHDVVARRPTGVDRRAVGVRRPAPSGRFWIVHLRRSGRPTGAAVTCSSRRSPTTLPAVRVEGVPDGLKALVRLPPDVDESAVVTALD